MKNDQHVNKDLILREKLALQRTVLANQSTFLSFLRTSMYFLMAGLTLQNLFPAEKYTFFEILLFVISAIVLILGIFNYFKHKNWIRISEIHVGNYKSEFLGSPDVNKNN
jgi:putative membrane protein